MPISDAHRLRLAEGNAKSAAIRYARSALKQSINWGEIAIVTVIEDPPSYIDNMTLYDILKAQHRWSNTKVEKFLDELGLNYAKTMVTLTQRQRDQIVIELLRRPNGITIRSRYKPPTITTPQGLNGDDI